MVPKDNSTAAVTPVLQGLSKPSIAADQSDGELVSGPISTCQSVSVVLNSLITSLKQPLTYQMHGNGMYNLRFSVRTCYACRRFGSSCRENIEKALPELKHDNNSNIRITTTIIEKNAFFFQNNFKI